jgi:glyoxylase-like metal-dependent hydrolase (beta-lactamase superfamily II)
MKGNPSGLFRSMAGKSPEEAKFFWTGGPVELAERTWFQSLGSGCTGFETDEGLVLVDAGTVLFAPVLAERLRSQTDAPVHTAIYTHGHVDHAYGLRRFLVNGQARPRVIAHREVPARFARYERTPLHNRAINARQFGGTVDAQVFETGDLSSAFGTPEYPPDTLYDDRLTLSVGGLEFELHHCRGETDDHTWVYCPQRGVLCPGDLFIWGVPNAGNPQKAQRYPWDWAAGLREMAACRPQSMGPGHGGPVVNDSDLLQRMLLETADYLDALVKATIAALEDRSPPHVDIVRRIEAPPSSSPWLQPVYDEAEFIVRNVVRHFGGWWNGRPSDLKPAPREAVAHVLAELAGGPSVLAEKARQLAQAGELQLASHLADFALEAAPADPKVASVVAELYDRRADEEAGLMSTNLFRSAAAYARAGRAFA